MTRIANGFVGLAARRAFWRTSAFALLVGALAVSPLASAQESGAAQAAPAATSGHASATASIASPAAGATTPLGAELTFTFARVQGASEFECTIKQGAAKWSEIVSAGSSACSADRGVVHKKFKPGKATFRLRAKVGGAWTKPAEVAVKLVAPGAAPGSSGPAASGPSSTGPAPAGGPSAPANAPPPATAGSPMSVLLAKMATSQGPSTTTATSQAAALILPIPFSDKRRPVSALLTAVKLGSTSPGSWDAAYTPGFSSNDTLDKTPPLVCPNMYEVKDVKVAGGQLTFQTSVGRPGGKRGLSEDSILPITVAIGADGSFSGTAPLTAAARTFLAANPDRPFPAGVTTVTVSGKLGNDDRLLNGEVVNYGRVLKAQVTPTGTTTVGCAFSATAIDYFDTRECKRRDDVVNHTSPTSDGRWNDRCCRGLVETEVVTSDDEHVTKCK